MPVLTVIAGPNGSGKSTLINMLVKRGIEIKPVDPFLSGLLA